MRFIRVTRAMIASVLIFWNSESSAQSESIQGEQTANTLEEIIVTARRRAERLQDVPVSASVVSGESLSRFNIQNLEILAERIPNVRIGAGPLSDLINIRGVGSSLNLGFEQSVGIFSDGIYRPRSRSVRAALFDIEQVEVLKGAQTTYFGNNAIAGAINITTRKPSDVMDANASAYFVPNTEEYTVEAGTSLPVNDQLAVRLAGRANGMDGYIENVYLNDMSPRTREYIGRFSAKWTPADNISTDARFDYGRMRHKGNYSTQLISCPPPPEFLPRAVVCSRHLAASGGVVDDDLDGVSATAGSFFNYDYLEAAQTTTVGLGVHDLVFTTGYYDHDYDLLQDVLPVPPNRGGSVFNTTQSLPVLIIEQFDLFSQEVRLQSPLDEKLEYQMGLYYYGGDLDVETYQGQFFLPFGAFASGFFTPADKIAFNVNNRENTDTYSAFASITANLSAFFGMNVGARYTVVDKEAHRTALLGTVAGSIPNPQDFRPGPLGGQAILLPIVGVESGDFDRTSRTDKKFMPTASITFDLNNGMMAYVSYAKGFKAGGFAGYSGKSVFEPETVDAFEAGLKSTFLNGMGNLNLAAFYSDYSDLQETTTIFTQIGTTRQIIGNVAKSTSKGVEFGAALIIADGVSISGDIGYLNAKYKDYTAAPCTARQSLSANPCTQNLSGKRRAYAPEWSGNVGLAVVQPISGSLDFKFDADVYFTSRFFQQPIADASLSQSGYAKIDLRIGVGPSDRNWELALVGKNLTDKRTASFRQNIASPGSFQFLEDPGRTVGVNMSWKY